MGSSRPFLFPAIVVLASLLRTSAEQQVYSTDPRSTACGLFLAFRTMNGTTDEDLLLNPSIFSMGEGSKAAANRTGEVQAEPGVRTGGTTIVHSSGGNVTGLTVVDFGNMERATALLKGSARVVFQDVNLTGSCFRFRAVDQTLMRGWLSNSHMPYFLQEAAAVQRFKHVRVTELSSIGEVLSLQYLFTLARVPFPEVPPVIDSWLKTFPRALAFISSITPTSFTFASAVFPNSAYIQRTFEADPAAMGLDPSTVAMRMCNGPGGGGRLLTSFEKDVNRSVVPIWPATSGTQLQAALQVAVLNQSSHLALPTIMLYDDIGVNAFQSSNESSSSGSGAPRLTSSALLILAPLLDREADAASNALAANTTMPGFNYARSTSDGLMVTAASCLVQCKRPVINLAGLRSEALLYVGGPANTSARLLLFNLGLRGLRVAPLAPLLPAVSPLAADAAGMHSALPLWAFRSPDPKATAGLVMLHTATLILPKQDYTVLVAAVLRGTAWRSAATSAVSRVILSGVTDLVPAPGYNYTANMTQRAELLGRLRLQSYMGWHVNATNLWLQPEEPLAANEALPDWGPLMRAHSSATSRNVAVGLGVGLGIGIPVLLGVGASLVLVALRARQGAKGAPLLGCRCLGGDDWDAPTVALDMAAEMGSPAADKAACGGPAEVCTLPPDAPPSMWRLYESSRQLQQLLGRRASSRLSPQPEMGASGHLLKPDSRVTSSDSPRATARQGTDRTSGKGSVSDAYLEGPSSKKEVLMGVVESMSSRIPRIKNEDQVTLLNVLGKGSWGTVYRARWRGIDCAVKTVMFTSRTAPMSVASDSADESDSSSRQSVALAVNEAATCLSISHRNVVATYHYDIKPVVARQEQGQSLVVGGEARGEEWKLFLIQELCACSLENAVDRQVLHIGNRVQEPALVLWLLADIASGLVHLHNRRIVHGDLKPANVLLKVDAKAPAGCVAKLADFGLAAAMRPDETHLSDYRRGTPFWMAPEVLNHARVSTASDMYTLGVLMWAVYTREEPANWVEAESKFQPNPSFPSLPPNTSPEFVDMVRKCLSVEPSARPSASEVLVGLVAILLSLEVDYATQVALDTITEQ